MLQPYIISVIALTVDCHYLTYMYMYVNVSARHKQAAVIAAVRVHF